MPTHEELITVGQFNEKFKRTLLNYFSYGFMNIGSFGKKQRNYKAPRTLREDWNRLNRIIADYSEWIESSKDKLTANDTVYITADSESMEGNPFQRVYRFCGSKLSTYPAFFLHTMAAMSNQIHLRSPMTDDEGTELPEQDKFKTSALLPYYTDRLVPPESSDKNRTPNNRLDDLAALGVVTSEQNPGSHNRNGDHRWKLSAITMRSLLSVIDGGRKDGSFERRFLAAIDFFSRYFLLGEVGMYLKDRMGYDESDSIFRFKHDYFMQALNDYNIVDLLFAIENEKWCKIKYSHGTSDFTTELLCYPLQIRISDQNGREYLMYYEPFKRSYTSLRIEFIDSLEYFEKKDIEEVLSIHHGKTGTADSDIENARNALKYCWGVSPETVNRNGKRTVEGNAIYPVVTTSVKLQFQYDPQEEPYIPIRIRKECRNGFVPDTSDSGSITFHVDVTDPGEMIPWIRSFYTRLNILSGFDENTSYSMEHDVDRIKRLISQETGLEAPVKKDPPRPWEIPKELQEKLTTGKKAVEHEKLFHEVFSTYYYIISDVFSQMSVCNATDFSERDFQRFYRESLSVYAARTGLETEYRLQETVKNVLLGDDFVQEGTVQITTEAGNATLWRETRTVDVLIPRYQLSEVKFYRDIVPLSTYEIRWLKTILDDEKMLCFLDKNTEIEPLKRLLEDKAQDLKPLPIKYVEHFDRFHCPKRKAEKEQAVISVLLDSIQKSNSVSIRYRANNHTLHEGEYYPIVIEFSKRNNYFQCVCCTPLYDDIITMNVAQIESITINGTQFNACKANQALQDYRSKQTRTVEIEFYDIRNAVDRILTEFAPWRKECRYNRQTDLYTLKLYYQQQDEKEILIRLMGYGPLIRIKEQEHSIAKLMSERINKQYDLFRSHEREDRDRGNEGR